MATGGHPPRSPHAPPGPLPRSRVVVLDDDVVVVELDLCAHEQPDGVGLYQRNSRPRPRWFLR